MQVQQDIAGRINAIEELLSAKFGVKKRGLRKMLSRTGRRLPKAMHGRAEMLLKAQKLAEHPKLSRQIDHRALVKAQKELVAHLEAIDVRDRRKGMLLNLAGDLVFKMLLVGVAFVGWLWWAGYL